MSIAPEEMEDRENYIRPYVWVSPNGHYKITIYFEERNGKQVVDDVVGEEVDTVPTLDEIF